MIIADKIIMLRKKNGWSQEELAEQLNVSRQSVSKWESGLSIPDLNKVIAMSTLFGVSTDFLLKDELEEISPSETSARDDAPARSVSAEEANRYLALSAKHAGRIALGVVLCILSPVLLILLTGAAGVGLWSMPETTASAIGIAALLLMVGAAIAIFIPSGMQFGEFSYLEKESISLAYGVFGIVEKRRADYAARHRLMLTCGVLLCVLGALPLIILGVLEKPAFSLIICTCLLLGMCALGVCLLVWSSCVYASFEKLLQTGDYTEENKQKSRKTEAAESAYWCVVTAAYLGVSFLTGAWHITWVAWPVAGCLWAALSTWLARKWK